MRRLRFQQIATRDERGVCLGELTEAILVQIRN